MRRSLLKRAMGAGLAIAATASLVMSAAPAAHATPNTDIIAAAGSDTIMDVTAAILQADGTAGKVFNIRAGGNQSTPLLVPGTDGFCNPHVYHNAGVGGWPATSAGPQTSVTVNNVNTHTNTSIDVASGTPFTTAMIGRQITGTGIDGTKTVVITAVPVSPGNNATISAAATATGTATMTIIEGSAPDGSGDGAKSLHNSRDAIAPYNGGGAEVGPNGCVDIGRSSSGRTATSDSTTEWYAFAIDGVMWGTSSINAPATLTQSQLQGIYNCTYNDWSQVGGSPGPIARTIPQVNSGTGKFAKTNLLGVASGFTNFPNTGPNGACAPVITIQENQFYDEYHGSNVYGGGAGDATQYPNAIGLYSAGKWSFQAGKDTNPSIDLRSGFRPGALTVAEGTASGPVLGVAWNGANWQLNNSTVVGPAATSPRSESLTTTTNNVVTLNPSTTNLTNVHTTSGSFVVTAALGTFTQGMVGFNITNGTGGIPNGSSIASVAADGGSATFANAAGTSATATGTDATFPITSVFQASDAGSALSGNPGTIANGTTITAVLSATTAQISANAVSAGTVTELITPNAASTVKNVTLTSTTAGNATLHAAPGTFAATDVGRTLDSTCTYPAQTIATFVDSSTVTVDAVRGALANCTNQPAKIGFTAVSSGNVFATVGAQAPWPGARFVFHIIDSTVPDAAQARGLVGYTDSPGGAKSPLCSSAHDLDNGGSDGIIADNGFLPIAPHTSAGGNTNVSCYKF